MRWNVISYRRSDLSRAAAGALVTASLLAGLGAAGCADDEPEPEEALAATFEVAPEGALVSVFAERSRRAAVRVEDAAGAAVLEVDVELRDIGVGGLGVATLTGLAPDSAYRYQVALERGATVGPYHLRTAPAPDADAGVHFVFSADIDISSEFDSPIFETLAATGADFLLSLGDWPYADNAPSSVTLAEYRARHREVRAPARIQGMLRALPVYATWDDHEALNNWDSRVREAEPERVANAVAAWREWFPLRATQAGEERYYRNWRWGRHAEFFMLDTRSLRSNNYDPDGPDKTMLGAEQRAWLLETLLASEATFKFVITSVPMAGRLEDKWGGFAYERDQILTEIAQAGVSGLLFLAGDGHRFTAYRLPGWGLREFMVGPLARHPSPLPASSPEIVAQAMGYNFGEIRVAAEGAGGAPELVFTCRDAGGEELYRERFQAGDLVLTPPAP